MDTVSAKHSYTHAHSKDLPFSAPLASLVKFVPGKDAVRTRRQPLGLDPLDDSLDSPSMLRHVEQSVVENRPAHGTYVSMLLHWPYSYRRKAIEMLCIDLRSVVSRASCPASSPLCAPLVTPLLPLARCVLPENQRRADEQQCRAVWPWVMVTEGLRAANPWLVEGFCAKGGARTRGTPRARGTAAAAAPESALREKAIILVRGN